MKIVKFLPYFGLKLTQCVLHCVSAVIVMLFMKLQLQNGIMMQSLNTYILKTHSRLKYMKKCNLAFIDAQINEVVPKSVY